MFSPHTAYSMLASLHTSNRTLSSTLTANNALSSPQRANSLLASPHMQVTGHCPPHTQQTMRCLPHRGSASPVDTKDGAAKTNNNKTHHLLNLQLTVMHRPSFTADRLGGAAGPAGGSGLPGQSHRLGQPGPKPVSPGPLLCPLHWAGQPGCQDTHGVHAPAPSTDEAEADDDAALNGMGGPPRVSCGYRIFRRGVGVGVGREIRAVVSKWQKALWIFRIYYSLEIQWKPSC